MQSFGDSGGNEREFHAPGDWEKAFDDEAAKEGLIGRAGVSAFDEVAGLFQEGAVLNAGGAGDFAGAATEAEIDVADAGVVDGQSAGLEGAHEVDAAARGFVFVAGLEIGGTRAEAEAAVNAGEGFFLVEEIGGSAHANCGKMCLGS